MSNPWLKNNPFMSIWLSAAHSVANTARGQLAATAQRQSRDAVTQMTQQAIDFWTGAWAAPQPRPRRRARR